MNKNTCSNCRFGLQRSTMYSTHSHEYVECRRFPQEMKKKLEDWCGEFVAREVATEESSKPKRRTARRKIDASK